MLTFDGWSAFFFLPKVPPPPPPTLKPLLRVEAALGKSLATIDFRLFFLITSRRRRAAGRAIPICKVREKICILKKILYFSVQKALANFLGAKCDNLHIADWQTPIPTVKWPPDKALRYFRIGIKNSIHLFKSIVSVLYRYRNSKF